MRNADIGLKCPISNVDKRFRLTGDEDCVGRIVL